MRIACPPITHSCTYGINTPTTELAAARFTPDELFDMVGADSLQFLPLLRLKKLSDKPQRFCYACMDGKYWHDEK